VQLPFSTLMGLQGVNPAKKSQLTVPESPAFQTKKTKTAAKPSVSYCLSFVYFESAWQIPSVWWHCWQSTAWPLRRPVSLKNVTPYTVRGSSIIQEPFTVMHN